MKMPFVSQNTELIKAKHALSELQLQFLEVTEIIKQTEKGNLNIQFSKQLADSELGISLLSMQNHLVHLAKEENERNWSNSGLAKFAEILRNSNAIGFTALMDCILSNLINYLHSNQGAIFIIQEDESLKMVACYAYDRKKYIDAKIEKGQGLLGQCVLEQAPIYLTDIPSNYVQITSGLGHATPNTLYIVPLIINDKVYGVMELASFSPLEKYQTEFINRLSESIASTIKYGSDFENNQRLLLESQQQTEELRAQEEEIRQNMEEMQTIQEDLERKTFELKVREDVFTLTTILSESDLFGTITYANKKLEQVSQYSQSELLGKGHNLFRHPDMPKELFKLMWATLKKGEIFKGIVKNRAKDGTPYWVDGCFVPVKDHLGNIVKYVGARYYIENEEMALRMYKIQALKLGLPTLTEPI